jgi:hypothetical protein
MGDLPGTQVRVVQGKEPFQFLALFAGRMVVSRGGVDGAGGFASGQPVANAEGNHLFHIRGSNNIDTRAVEVAPEAASLNRSVHTCARVNSPVPFPHSTNRT